jgi:hypothetical protein
MRANNLLWSGREEEPVVSCNGQPFKERKGGVVRSLFASLVVILTSLDVCSASDLAKIDRTIFKEPIYQTKPKYCLLVLGPEARTRIWLVQDGDILYVDRNGNGDLTETGESVKSDGRREKFEIGTIVEANGKTKHTDLVMHRYERGMQIEMKIEGKRKQFTGYGLQPEQPSLQFGDSPRSAPIVHFNGPLVVRPRPGLPVLQPGQDNPVHVELGTPGLGQATFVFFYSHPEEGTPGAELDFGDQVLKISLSYNG